MTTDADTNRASKAQLDAETIVLKVLDLIKDSNNIDGFTKERISKFTGLALMPYGSNSFGHSAELTPDWWYTIEMAAKTVNGPQFMLSFDPSDPKKTPPIADVCKINLARFSSELENAGFEMEVRYGLHGEVAFHSFTRPGLSVRVNTAGQECLRFVTIN